ncbi:MAG: ADP-heptose--LPS heptosyltransferase 2 [Candidatus Anoxychlamydiales bacterium]|nr:ADP-heptose--LPS heptosyltransferase 2 [Candidatus Anoxychlamydiales bacterium]HEU64116.1 lipopolysaccharide heptosyltransferase II [Chlamydiota bacterium]
MKDTEYKNIIVRMPNWVGDLVMATPILFDLRQKFPASTITAMVQKPLCDLLKKDENINELFCFKKIKQLFLRRKENKNIIENLIDGKYDLGILLTNSFSSAWLFYQGEVKNIIGFRKDFRSLMLNKALSYPKEQIHQVEKYKQLLKPLDIERSITKPKIYVDKKEIENAKELLYQRGYKDDQRLIGINPVAKYGMAKCWPIERYKEVAKRLCSNEKNFIVFLGDFDSRDVIKNICLDMPDRVINLAGKTTLRELVALISQLDLFLTNDSGPMHIAAGFDIDQIALFGSTSDVLTGPYSEKAIVINKKVECSPCYKRVCPIDFRCMLKISVDEVFDKMIDILKKK